jgi:predicted RNase H-like nuclease (RuvC/YqgF family)
MRRFRSGFSTFGALVCLVSLTGCFEKESVSDEEAAENESYQKEKAERDSIRDTLSELRAEKKELESRMKTLTKAASEKPEITAKELEISTQLEEVRAYTSSLNALEGELDLNLQTWRAATRNSFKGVVLPEIVTTDGAKYSGVTIKEVTDENLVILHSGGEATLPILQLPVGLRKNVIHEPTVLADQAAPLQ